MLEKVGGGVGLGVGAVVGGVVMTVGASVGGTSIGAVVGGALVASAATVGDAVPPREGGEVVSLLGIGAALDMEFPGGYAMMRIAREKESRTLHSSRR